MHNKKIVALLTNHDDDVYCFRKELIESFVKEGYKVIVSCPYGPKIELMPKSSEIEYRDIYIDRRGTNPIKDLKLFLEYLNFMKEVQPDIVLCYTAKPNVYGSIAAKMSHIPYINNVTGLGSVLKKGKFLKMCVMLLFKLAYRSSACIFFQNEENMKLALKKGFVNGKYKLIPGSGVDLKRFPVQKYPNNGTKTIFNYIGRVLKDKGVDDYIEVAKRVHRNHQNTEFNIIGFIEPTEEYYRDELKKLEEQGIVYYRGSQNDVRPFIKRSDAIIHPSTYGEGISNVLLENAASGRPIITTDNPGCKETVEKGKTGFIYRGGNVNELEKTVEYFLTLDVKERENIGLLGRKRVETFFSRSIVIESYLEILKEVFSYDRER